MLRACVWFLLLLNVLYGSWAQGWLLPYGFGPIPQREPQRLAQQIHPELITLSSPAELTLKSQPRPPEPTLCLETEPMSEAQVALLRTYLEASWPAESWVFEVVPGQRQRLRLPAVNEALEVLLPELRAVLPPGGLESCPEFEAEP